MSSQVENLLYVFLFLNAVFMLYYMACMMGKVEEKYRLSKNQLQLVFGFLFFGTVMLLILRQSNDQVGGTGAETVENMLQYVDNEVPTCFDEI